MLFLGILSIGFQYQANIKIKKDSPWFPLFLSAQKKHPKQSREAGAGGVCKKFRIEHKGKLNACFILKKEKN